MVKRMLATLVLDLRLQWRNGFYYASAFVLTVLILLLRWLPNLDWGWVLPVFVLGNMLLNGFYFIGGLVLLEKGEGTLEAQVVTPLRDGEYLASKVLSLALLSTVENGLVMVLLYGPRFALLPALLGIVTASVLYSLAGFVAVARYDSINEYLLPSMGYTLLLFLPLLDYLGIWSSPIFYLHPLQASLTLLTGAFQPLAGWQWLYGVLYAALWIGLMGWLSRRAFARFVVARQGV